MLRIMGRLSSINVRKVLWTAAEVDIDFVHEADWGDTASTRNPAFLALNPNGLVPVAVSHEGVLWESNTICRYIAMSAKREDLLPATPFARAEVEKWMDWQATDLNTAWRPAFLGLVRGIASISATEIERSVQDWNRLMLGLEQRIAETGAYVSGSRFTLADIGLGLSLQRWLLTPITRPNTPALLTYRERLISRRSASSLLSSQIP